MAGVRIGLVCDQLRAPTPAGRLVGVSCERRLGRPWLHGHALQSGTRQVRVPRRRYDFGDAYQPELVCFAGDSDSLLLAESPPVWNLGFLKVFSLKTQLRETPSLFARPRSARCQNRFESILSPGDFLPVRSPAMTWITRGCACSACCKRILRCSRLAATILPTSRSGCPAAIF